MSAFIGIRTLGSIFSVHGFFYASRAIAMKLFWTDKH